MHLGIGPREMQGQLKGNDRLEKQEVVKPRAQPQEIEMWHQDDEVKTFNLFYQCVTLYGLWQSIGSKEMQSKLK